MKTDKLPDFLVDILLACTLLTRVPLPQLSQDRFTQGARAVWAYPLAGILPGLVAVLGAMVMLSLSLPSAIAAGGALALMMLCTGAMHEDGLADTADGFWGGFTPTRRLEIMKDSQIGTYGTLALIMITGTRWLAYAALLPSAIWTILAAAILSRGILPGVMHILPHARDEGLSHSVGRPGKAPAATSLLLGSAFAALLTGLAGYLGILVAIGAAFAVSLIAKRKIGGQTGDVLGAVQQLSELAFICAVLAFGS